MYITTVSFKAYFASTPHAARIGEIEDAQLATVVKRASQRIDGLVMDGEDLTRSTERYTNNMGPGMVAIPQRMKAAVAELALWYIDNPLDQNTSTGENLINALSPQMADLPLNVQTLLLPFFRRRSKKLSFTEST